MGIIIVFVILVIILSYFFINVIIAKKINNLSKYEGKNKERSIEILNKMDNFEVAYIKNGKITSQDFIGPTILLEKDGEFIAESNYYHKGSSVYLKLKKYYSGYDQLQEKLFESLKNNGIGEFEKKKIKSFRKNIKKIAEPYVNKYNANGMIEKVFTKKSLINFRILKFVTNILSSALIFAVVPNIMANVIYTSCALGLIILYVIKLISYEFNKSEYKDFFYLAPIKLIDIFFILYGLFGINIFMDYFKNGFLEVLCMIFILPFALLTVQYYLRRNIHKVLIRTEYSKEKMLDIIKLENYIKYATVQEITNDEQKIYGLSHLLLTYAITLCIEKEIFINEKIVNKDNFCYINKNHYNFETTSMSLSILVDAFRRIFGYSYNSTFKEYITRFR